MLYSQQYRIWDFWATSVGRTHHLFYLKAPRTGLPQSRHDQAVIGHAISTDWEHWVPQVDALRPPLFPAWDDLSLWTGSVIRSDTHWLMFYTGRDRRSRTQNIGVAESDDLSSWQRSPSEPILPPDSQWYVTAPEESSETFTWRDPYAVRDAATGLYYLFIAAHDRRQVPGYSGAVAAAVSEDLRHWSLLPPVLSPGWFRDLEVPTVIQRQGRWYLYCSVKSDWYHPSNPFSEPRTTTLCFQSPNILGPYLPVAEAAECTPALWYACRPVYDEVRGYLLMGWRMGAEEGYADTPCSYGVDDPIPLCPPPKECG